ncbi:chlorophyllide reductase [Bradyrhizobium sp. Arg237L]|uniref:chlorophyllide reductase n=1 Tax=Bradyrhizobium sp. Arg237L TaxID=3003352 RepID=UPI00249D8D19|nr:chlorophyllide reductase [Bradyrhizobium sp. Arg237L]MDI4236262.1 chlorophyllide reductase [Bradyrhizobium sp. Arg237L]
MLNRLTAGIASVFVLIAAAHAQPSTSRAQISVAQVKAMLDQASTNPTARQVLTAYLAAAGETAGWLLDAARDQGLPLPPCARRLTLDAKNARDAIEGAPNTAPSTETAATPLIVRDMLKRAGCRLAD